MLLNTFCGNLGSTDFDDPEQLRAILFQDKHTRIEGLCSEAAFMEDVIKGNFDPVASDFWFSLESGHYHVRKIMPDPAVWLNTLDYEILDRFTRVNPAIPVSIVYFHELSRTFRQFPHAFGQRYDSPDQLGAVMPARPQAESAPEKDRDPVRLRKACDFLEERGLLREAAIKRLFANCWLGESVWDVDAFVQNKMRQIVALEVKQKYPTAKGTYGINNGQKNLFDFLAGIGIPVIHIILRKPDRDKGLHAVDLLTKPEYTGKADWVFTRINASMLTPAWTPAPRSTSISGQMVVAYHHIDTRHFAILKKYRIPAEGLSVKLLAGT